MAISPQDLFHVSGPIQTMDVLMTVCFCQDIKEWRRCAGFVEKKGQRESICPEFIERPSVGI